MTIAELLAKAHNTPNDMTHPELLTLTTWAIQHDQVATLPWRTDWPIPALHAGRNGSP